MKNTIDKVGCSTLSKTALTAVILASMTMGVNAADTQVYSLDPVVVTATRTEESIKDVPASTEVVTQKDFKRVGAYSVRSALKLATNLDLAEAGMTGNAVRIRGMDSAQTLILVNGQRMAGEDAGETANVYELDRFNLSDVDRIEIVRGASSALYGSDAMGGVINIITKKPADAGMTVGAAVGTRENNNYYHYDLGQQGKFNGSFDANFSKIRKYSLTGDGNTALYGPRQNFNFDGEYTLSEGRSINANLGYMKEKLRGNYADNPGYGYKNRYQLFNNERKSAGVAYQAKTGDSDFFIRAYYNQLNKDNDTSNNGKFSNFDRAIYKTYVVEAQDTTRLSDEHRLTFGGDYRKLQYEGTRVKGSNSHDVTVGGITKNMSTTEMTFYSAFVQDEWTPSEKWLIVPAIRYDHSDKYGSFTAPKVGVTYKFNDHFRFKTNYGKGFRAPSLSQLYMDAMPMGPMYHILGNPDLKPEKSVDWDAGVEGEFGNAFGSITYFHNKVTDLIGSYTLSGSFQNPPLVSTYINVNKATLEGIEAELGYHLTNRWTLKGTWNYLDAKDDESNERIDGRARHYGTVQLLYDNEDPYGVSGIFWYQYANSYLFDGKDYDYNLFNISVNKKWGDRLSAYVGLDNIFNKELPDIYIAGRTWRAGVEWKF